MFSGPVMIAALIGLVTFSVGGLLYALLFAGADARADKRREQVRAKPVPAVAVRQVVDPAKRRKSVQETLKEMEERQRAKARRSSSPPLTLRLQQAGLGWSRQTFFIVCLVCGLVVLAVAIILKAPIYAAAAFAVASAVVLPRFVVNFLRTRRLKKFTNEFPNAVDVIVRGVKAGLPLHDCIRMIAQESAEPVRTEFRMINEAQSVGVSLAEAVARLPERVPISETNFFAIAITIQQKTGGNLSEALGNLSRMLRERKRMKGKITAMSMEAKASAAIIGVLPPIVMILVYISSPDYILLLFSDILGRVILGASLMWMAIGILIMRKMINFDY